MSATFDFSPGAFGTAASYNFVSTFDAIQPDKDDELTRRFGRQRLTGIMDMFNLKKPTTNIKYEHFEEDRLYPKIKATNGGAGLAGAAVVFSIEADAALSIPLNTPPYIGTGSQQAVTVRKQDVILIKPGTGTVSYGNYIQCIVIDVDESAGANGEFTAQPTDPAQSIPSIAAADEIIIIGNAHGEGSVQPRGLVTRTTEFTNTVQIFKDTMEVTGTEACVKNWYKGRNGSHFWMLKGESETYDRFLNARELNMLFSRGLTNTSLADVYAAAETPIVMNKGLASEILDRGNEYNYASATGLSINDLDCIVLILDKQRGSKQNMMCNGIELNGQIDRELGDRFVNGGISYGIFKMDQEKHVSLQFKTVDINGYYFSKKVLEAFNDLQSTGAAGFGFPAEGMILPTNEVTDKNEGIKVPSMRLRFLKKQGKESQEMVVRYVDNFHVNDEGLDTEEVRYKSYCGIESFAMNRAVYVKKA